MFGKARFDDAATFAAIPDGADAVLPIDGRYEVDPAAAKRLGRVRWYTIGADYARAGAIDWELGNPCFTAHGLQRFVRGREAMRARARVYLDRADAAAAVDALSVAGLLRYPGLLWWVATLDGRPWTPEELAADLRDRWHADIHPGQIWANQNRTVIERAGPVDVSDLFLPW